MDEARVRVLLVDSDAEEADRVKSRVREGAAEALEIEHVARLEDAEGRLESGGYAAALVDVSRPESAGLGGLASLHAEYAELPVVALVGAGDRAGKQQAFALGAIDCVARDELDGPRLAHCVDAAVMRSRLRVALDEARHEAVASDGRLLELLLMGLWEPIGRKRDPSISRVPRDRSETRAEVASRASEIRVRAHEVSVATGAAHDRLDKALDIVRTWSEHEARAEARALVIELLESVDATTRSTEAEMERLERTADAIVRRLGRGRVYARKALDELVRHACERARTRLPTSVHLDFEGHAGGILVGGGEDIVSLTENLLRGLGQLARGFLAQAVDLRVETNARPDGALLAVTLELRHAHPEIGARIVEAVVAEARDGHAELSAAAQELRRLGGGLRVSGGTGGSVHLSLHLPST